MKKIIKIVAVSSLVINLFACSEFTEISSSTSSTVDAVTPDIALNEFFNKRFVAIRHDAAKGEGENLDALAQLLGEKDKRVFASKMKANFDSIFKEIEKPSQIISRIENTITINKG